MNPGSQKGIRLAVAGLGLFGLCGLGFALIVLNLSPALILALAIGGIALPILVLRPEVGLHLFVMLIFVESLAEEDRVLTVSKFSGALILGGWLLSIAVSRRLNVRLNSLSLVMLAFVGWAALGITEAFNSQVAIRQVLTYLQLAVAMLMVGSVVDTPDKVRRLLLAIVFWTTLAASHGLMTYALGAPTTAGILVNRNTMANYAAFAIACAYLLYHGSRGAHERLALAAAIPILFVALALSFSRTGVIEIGVVIAILGFRLARQHGYFLLGGTLLMLLVISLALPTKFYSRVESIGPSMKHQEETFGQRVELVQAGFRMIAAHPFVGVGAGNYPEVLNRYGRSGYTISGHWASHNTLVGVAAESGLPAVAFFVMAMVAAFRILWGVMRAGPGADPAVTLLALALESSLVALMVAGLSGNQEKTKFLYIFLGLVLSLDAIRRRSAALAGAPATPAPTPAIALPALPGR